MKTQLDKVLEVPVVGAEHAPNLVAFLAGHGITATAPPADLDRAIAEQSIDVALEIDADFAQDWRAGRPATVSVVHDSTRRNAEIPVARVRSALDGYASQVGMLRLMARGIDPSVTRPVSVGTRDMATDAAKRGMLLSTLLPYLLILTSFIGGAYLILDATAGERERQSLEPLLATPATRGVDRQRQDRRGLRAGAAVAAADAAGVQAVSAQLAGGMARMMDVSFLAIGKMLLVLLPMLFIGTALLTLLAASAKSMKEAQSHMTWLMLLPMIPTFVLMVNPIKTQLWQYAVPFLAQNQLLLKVIRAEPVDAQSWAVYLAAAFGLAAVLWFAAVRRYRQERLAIAG